MPKPSLIPAIIPRSLAHLRDAIFSLRGVAGEIQIDIVDGVLAPDKSWPYTNVSTGESIATAIAEISSVIPTGLLYEFDLMVENPLDTLPAWIAARPQSIVLHIESFPHDTDIMHAIDRVRAGGGGAILASLNDTPLERLCALVLYCDGVQCMGIAEIGRQGNPFDERVLERIATLRRQYHNFSISVDGSVNADTITALKAAGANRFVVGSGIFGADDPVFAYTGLSALVFPE